MPLWPRRRRAARVLVFDPQGRILLISASDPADRAARQWWEIPGGGIDPGEETSETAARELWEEAGIRDATIGPIVWTQAVQFTFGGWHFEQDEWVHVAYCDGQSSGPGGLEALEAIAFSEQRWWHPEEILSQSPRTIPYRLVEFLPSLLEGLPRSPLDITPTEQHVLTWRSETGEP